MRFADKFYFLSNFYPCKIPYDGVIYESAEHAYQAQKTANLEDRERIRNSKLAWQAKKIARTVTLSPNWEQQKRTVMANVLLQKFVLNPELRQQLLETERLELIEHNYWHDNFWGSCVCERCGDRGQNVLGKMLMVIREGLKS